MIKIKADHTDVVVSAMLSSMPISWETLRSLEEVRLSIAIDPSNLTQSLNALEESLPKDLIHLATRLSEELMGRYDKNEPKIVYTIETLRDRLWEMPYFTRALLSSELPSIWHALRYAYPWTIFLMVTDPSL